MLTKLKIAAKAIIALFCILYAAGWYHAESRCGTSMHYVYRSDYQMMPPVYKQAFIQFAFKGGYCKLL